MNFLSPFLISSIAKPLDDIDSLKIYGTLNYNIQGAKALANSFCSSTVRSTTRNVESGILGDLLHYCEHRSRRTQIEFSHTLVLGLVISALTLLIKSTEDYTDTPEDRTILYCTRDPPVGHLVFKTPELVETTFVPLEYPEEPCETLEAPKAAYETEIPTKRTAEATSIFSGENWF